MVATGGGVVTGPREIGPYELIRQLGGGMSTVYLARNREFGRQEVVVKILDRERAENELDRRRFEREAHVGARLGQHPHIVYVFANPEPESDDDLPYLVMQRIDGCSLSHLLRGGRLAPAEAVRVAGQMADALAHARRQLGIVHCDMKPSNILIHQGEQAVDAPSKARNLVAYLLDFGVARQLPVLTADTPTVKLPEEIFGTPPYMAPENLCPGDPPPPDHRVDVYGLTCVFFECLTGQQAFHRSVGETWPEVHGATDRPRPGRFDGTLAVFDEVVAAGLAVKAVDRIATTEELARRLDGALAEYATTVGDPGPSEPTIDIGRPAPDPAITPPRPVAPGPVVGTTRPPRRGRPIPPAAPPRRWSWLRDHVASPTHWVASIVGVGAAVPVALSATGTGAAAGLGAAAVAAGYGLVTGVVVAWRGSRRTKIGTPPRR